MMWRFQTRRDLSDPGRTVSRICAVALACVTACGAPVRVDFAVALPESIALPADGAGKRMRLIPGGWSVRGTDARDDVARPDERPAQRYGVSSFYMDETPVSYRDFRPYVAAAGEIRNHHWNYPIYNQPDQPVTGLNWFEAACYCSWRAQNLGLPVAYTSDADELDAYGYPVWERLENDAPGMRLPTEAEYEYAARYDPAAGTGEDNLHLTRFPWGNAFGPQGRRLANFDEGRGVPRGRWWRLSRVQDQQRTASGLYGMVGNVWEWSDDHYSPTTYADSEDENPRTSSQGRERPRRRLRGGGSWGSFDSQDLRIARRSYSAPGAYHFDVGFRCVLPAAALESLRGRQDLQEPEHSPAGSAANARPNSRPLPAVCANRIRTRQPPVNASRRAETFGESFRARLGNYLADYFPESVYFQIPVDAQPVLTPRQLADLITAVSLEFQLHPLFLTGIMRAESGMGTVSFPRWFNSPMAYHWQNAQMPNGLPQYRPGPGRNRKYATLRDGFRAYARGVRWSLYINAAVGNLYRFHYIYVGYDAPEWMESLTMVYREVLGVRFTPEFPARGAGALIYLDWAELR